MNVTFLDLSSWQERKVYFYGDYGTSGKIGGNAGKGGHGGYNGFDGQFFKIENSSSKQKRE